MRNVAFKWVAEHTMSTATSFVGNPGQAMKTSTKNLVQTLQNLYHKLHNGFIGVGVNRIPIAGDTTKLPLATGLTKLEQKLAWDMHLFGAELARIFSALFPKLSLFLTTELLEFLKTQQSNSQGSKPKSKDMSKT